MAGSYIGTSILTAPPTTSCRVSPDPSSFGGYKASFSKEVCSAEFTGTLEDAQKFAALFFGNYQQTAPSSSSPYQKSGDGFEVEISPEACEQLNCGSIAPLALGDGSSPSVIASAVVPVKSPGTVNAPAGSFVQWIS
jgi:hypothetical protein